MGHTKATCHSMHDSSEDWPQGGSDKEKTVSGLTLGSQHQCLKDPFYFCAMSHELKAMKQWGNT